MRADELARWATSLPGDADVQAELSLTEVALVPATADGDLASMRVAVRGDSCTCNPDAGVGACTFCMDRAWALEGKRVRDSYDREFVVEQADEKNGIATVSGDTYWAYIDDVEVLA